MSVLDRDFLLGFLPTLGVANSDDVADKVLEYQRLVGMRRSSRPSLLRNAALVEAACRSQGVVLSRERLLAGMGVARSASEYRRELSVCEAALGVKRDASAVERALSLSLGAEPFKAAKATAAALAEAYVCAIPAQQHAFVDVTSPLFTAAFLFLAAKDQKVKQICGYGYGCGCGCVSMSVCVFCVPEVNGGGRSFSPFDIDRLISVLFFQVELPINEVLALLDCPANDLHVLLREISTVRDEHRNCV